MNKLKGSIILLFFILSLSFGTKGQHKSQGTNETTKTNIALTFINEYVAYCNDRDADPNAMKWIASNKLLTKEFKNSYIELIEKATKKEPESGLGFDPIFDAQDYPEKGFEILVFDNQEYVTVSGKDWPTFTTIMKIRLVGDKWMVDGAGIINIPRDKQRSK